MRLIAAGAAFAEVYAEMHRQCFSKAWDHAAFAALFATPGTLGVIAEAGDGAPLGFCVCRVAADEAEILTIGVLPEARGRGVGDALIARAAAAAADQGAGRMFLEVAVTNASARRLYAQARFAPIGVRKNYYREVDSDGRPVSVDAEILARRLDAPPSRD